MQRSVNGGETRPLNTVLEDRLVRWKESTSRCFLTAIDLQIEDEGLEGDETQVRYVER
jgi:hypothetical protein